MRPITEVENWKRRSMAEIPIFCNKN